MAQSNHPHHVSIASSNFWPEPTGISRTVGEFAQFLADSGVRVRVATAMPYYPQWRIWPEYRGRWWCAETQNGVTVFRAWHYVSPRPTTVTRLLHETSLSLFAVPTLVRTLWRSDTVFIVSPALSYALTASLLAAILRVRRILVVKDVMPDAAIELGMLRNPIVIRASRLCARWVYALAHEIHTLCDGMRRRIAHDTRHAEKISIIPDTIDATELAPVPLRENAFRRQFVPDGTFAVVHSGNMGRKQDLDLLLRAAEKLRGDSGVHFYVFGDGADKTRFLQSLEERQLSNVSHFPLQDRGMLRHMLSGADVVLVSQLPAVVDIVVPSKLITAMAGGAMIVSACATESETAKLVTASGGGIVIPSSDAEALVAAIQAIRSGETDTERCRLDARAYAIAHFDRDRVYGPIAESFGGVGRNTKQEANFQESPEPVYSATAAPLAHSADGREKGVV